MCCYNRYHGNAIMIFRALCLLSLSWLVGIFCEAIFGLMG